MYFTSIEINRHRRSSRQVLGSPYLLHGAVGACFPPSAEAGRVLWRVDERLDGGTYLYLLSAVEPDPTGFVEALGWPRTNSWRTRDYKALLDAVEDGERFQFRLRANPVHNVRAGGSGSGEDSKRPRGKRLAHVTVAQQRQWFLERADRWGFTVGEGEGACVDVVDRRLWTFRKGGRTVTLGTATFEGELAVTDAGQFRRRLIDGFGPAKAYGCGLMTLAPPTS